MSRAAALIFQSSRVVGITLVRSVGSTEVGEIWRTLKNDLFNPYRPELHYMRGPGPKWREKHPHDRSLRSQFTV
jgi:hypothetical protein